MHATLLTYLARSTHWQNNVKMGHEDSQPLSKLNIVKFQTQVTGYAHLWIIYSNHLSSKVQGTAQKIHSKESEKSWTRTLLDTTRLLCTSTHSSFGYLDKDCTILRQSKWQLKWQRTLQGPILDRIAIENGWFPNEKEIALLRGPGPNRLSILRCEWPHSMHIGTTLIWLRWLSITTKGTTWWHEIWEKTG